jgi:hypothetical protein
MQAETMKSRKSFIEGIKPYSNFLIPFDLPALINIIKRSQTWRKGELYNMVLMKSPRKQILLTAIQGGTEISYFPSKESVTIQIIEGSIKYCTREGSGDLNEGQVIKLNERIRYTLTSREETVFLLTVLSGVMQPAES